MRFRRDVDEIRCGVHTISDGEFLIGKFAGVDEVWGLSGESLVGGGSSSRGGAEMHLALVWEVCRGWRTPAAISTKLGYILTGKIYTSQMPDSIVHSTLYDQSNKCWLFEKIPPNVDDLLAGADTEEEAKAIIAEIQNLMKSGRFSLRKWSSSHKIILKDLDKALLATESIHSLWDEEVKQRVLDIFWNLLTDSIQVRIADGEIVNTKRQLLSVIAKTFNPLGLFSPSVIILKIMLQELWKSKVA
ncbi:hypothetical protein HNY73_015132 [Argiope bruennichi]|uniref:Uncharacterized protein n=1 Tax=Argiope bruennichi TaxID=94029 RepID=A0A8T0ESJ1_ARGBR|nr:hypothetical protein HNY73_015132 [Argiope bruennichi]